MQIEPTAHFHPQLASKAEKVFPIPLNRKTLVGYPNTCAWKSISKNNAVLEQRFITFHDKSLFAVSILVYIGVHEIYVNRAIREHC